MDGSKQRLDGVDGLRAVAMTMVVAQHCGLMPFGWTGVWLFYVISGYVITQVLLRAKDLQEPAGRRYRHFLWKRFLRIVPVYLLYVLANVAVFYPVHAGQRLGDLPYLLTFTYNWQMVFNFWPGSGGWGAFGHLWTLSVEQQFYLVFPLLALLVPDRWQSRVMLFLVCLGPLLRWQWSGSLTAQGMAAGDVAFAVYSATHCHFDAFLMGALVARAQANDFRSQALPLLANRVAALAAGVAVVYVSTYVYLNIESGQRGVDALRNVISGILHGGGREIWVYVAVNLVAMAVLLHVLIGRTGSAWLGNRRLAWVGRVSYGGYLFHALVLWALGQWWLSPGGERPVADRIGIFVVAWLVTVALASVSYRWFEEPLARRWRDAFNTTRPGGSARQEVHV